MKYITFTIPCYNSENYMRRCVDSLLVGGEDVETMGQRANEFLAKARQRPEIGMIYTTLNTNTPVYNFGFATRSFTSLLKKKTKIRDFVV